jgi:cytochrome c
VSILFAAATLWTAAPARADGDAAAGAKVFLTCALCHSLDPEARKTGPHLRGVIGRRIGGVQGYRYSKGLARASGVWTEALLDEFLVNPRKMFPATRMVTRVPDDRDRADLIAYLKSPTSP